MACSEDARQNVAKAMALVRGAHAKGAQIVLIQELFETPYFCKDQLSKHFALASPYEGNALIAEFIGVKIFSLERCFGWEPLNWRLFNQVPVL